MKPKNIDFLGEFEAIVLLSLIKLGASAYGMKIRIELSERLGRDVSIGAVYTTLDRLESKGLVKSRLGDPTPERGGRAKKFFAITGLGQRTLENNLSALAKFSADAGVRVRFV